MGEKISIEIIPGAKNRRTEYILWIDQEREGTIDSHRRGFILTDLLHPSTRSRISSLALKFAEEARGKEANRISGVFGISDKEYLKKRRRAEAEDAVAAKALERIGEEIQGGIDTGKIQIR